MSKLTISTALLAASALIVNGAASAQATALDEYIQWVLPHPRSLSLTGEGLP